MRPRQQVPGGYQDTLSTNTELGRAVRHACDELELLGQMVRPSKPSYGCVLDAASSLHQSVSVPCEMLTRLQERDTVQEAARLLQKLGYRGDLASTGAQAER